VILSFAPTLASQKIKNKKLFFGWPAWGQS
jgi:hypothetical protein